MNIFKAMKPNAVYKDLSKVPLADLKAEGKTCVLLDFDNTLGPDHAPKPEQFAYDRVKDIHDLGMTCVLVSNAKTGRSAEAAELLGIPCVTYAHKPRPDGIYRALELMKVNKDEAIMVGDQIFTDVIAGRLAGVYTILVEKYSRKEVWYIVLKRPFEKIVRFFGRF